MRKIIAGPRRIQALIDKLASKILKNHPILEGVALVGIRCGGVPLTNRLRDFFHKSEGILLPCGYLDITLYRDDWTRIANQPQVKKTEIPFSIEDLTIILIDDVIFTGRTVRAALDALIDLGRPKKIELAVLVDRGGREFPIEPNYCALRLKKLAPDEYVDVYFRELSGKDAIIIESHST